jgi:hypothetical protein
VCKHLGILDSIILPLLHRGHLIILDEKTKLFSFKIRKNNGPDEAG